MFKAVGMIMVLWYLSSLFSQSFAALDSALVATLNALEAASISAEKQFVK